MDYKFRINKIVTKSGVEISPAKINIILGPNNSGKSRFLKDLKNLFQRQTSLNNNKIVSDLDFDVPADFVRFCETYLSSDNVIVLGDRVIIKAFSGMENPDVLSGGMSMESYVDSNNTSIYLSGGQNWQSQLIDSYDSAGDKKDYILNMFGKMFSIYMGTKERLLSVERRDRYGIEEQQMNLMSLCMDERNIPLGELYKLVWEYFGRGIYFDNTGVGTKKILFRTSDIEDMSKMSGRDLADCDALDDEGDGLKSFVATYLALKMKGKNVVMVDEPDAFLHPPLARQMGLLIAGSTEEDKQIFVSTHSAELLRAVVLKAPETDIKIFRVTREGRAGQIAEVNLNAMVDLLKGHDVAAKNALNGLFAKRVVVVESESDKIFYESMFSRLLMIEPEETMFLSAVDGKDKMIKMMKLLKSAGMDVKAIFDFDLLCSSSDHRRNGRTPLEAVLGYCDFDENEQEQLASVERMMIEEMGCGAWRKNGGVSRIGDADLRRKVEEVISKLARKGIFVVPTGELESILNGHGVEYSSNKDAWLLSALSKLKELTVDELRDLPVAKLIIESENMAN